MTKEQKLEWLENATNEELLHQLLSLNAHNHFGECYEDIQLTEAEILKRMSR